MQIFFNKCFRKSVFVTILLLNAIGLMAYGASIEGISFFHKDSQVGCCDNTGTCFVAGYSSEADSAFGFSVLLTRAATADQLVHGGRSLAIWDDEDLVKRDLELQVDNQNDGLINDAEGLVTLKPLQVKVLLNTAKADAYWLVDYQLKSAQFITYLGSRYAKGKISGALKGRGLGYSWSGEEYTWNGIEFISTYSFETEICRGQPGGFLVLPTTV